MTVKLSLIVILMATCIVTIYSSLTSINCPDSGQMLKSNISKPINRSKRFLVFEGNGVLKMVIGFSQPLNFLDRHPYRQLAVGYALHLQYNPPPRPVYWWTYFVNSTAWSHARTTARQRDSKQLVHSCKSAAKGYLKPMHCGTFEAQRHYRQPFIAYDASRFVIYKTLEIIFNSKGLPGERCLLRTICELSQRPLYENNAIHGIVNAIFSPSADNIDKKYLHAKEIGSRGLNCEKIYWSCIEVSKWLEKMSHYL